MEPILEPIEEQDEPVARTDFVHAVMVMVNRISIATVLAVVVFYGFLSYQGIIPTATHGTEASGAARLTMTSVIRCDGGSGANDRWLAPAHGPR
jgi:hypothetical protein